MAFDIYLNLALFLHIYQPPTQFPEVTKEITETSYLKIIDILKKNKRAKITLNICASLTEQLEKFKVHPSFAKAMEGAPRSLGEVGQSSKFKVLLGDIKKLAEEGRIEFTGSAAYHPLLPKIPNNEIVRQIKLNEQINKTIFGDVFSPSGFFPPEMAYERRVGEIVEKLGYKWLLLDESAFPRKTGFRSNDRLYKLKGTSLKVFFREREASLGIAFSKITTVSEFSKVFLDKVAPQSFIILAMDGETFGHHQIAQLSFLEEFLASSKFELVTISELLTKFKKIDEIEPLASTWGATIEDVEHGRIFPRWDNPNNLIHRLQWKLYDLALRVVESSDQQKHQALNTKYQTSTKFQILNSKHFGALNFENWDLFGACDFGFGNLTTREILDRAVHSDQFFWAAHDPCWHPQMVERGANMLKEVVLSVEGVSSKDKQKAEMLYDKIVQIGKELYGDEIVSC